MLVLAFDTATPIGSVAVVRDGAVLAELSLDAGLRHAETLLTEIQRALALAGATIADVALLAVGTGPGSFTGLRIALATAKGLALARPLTVIGVSSLAALARSVATRDGELIVPLLDAHKGEVYGAAYLVSGAGPLVEKVPPFSRLPSALALSLSDPLYCGDGLRLFTSAPGRVVDPPCDSPRAAALADEALRLLTARGPDDVATLEPTYVRDADTT